MWNKLIYSIVPLLILLFLLILRPINASEKNSKEISGEVVHVYGEKDIVFRLKDDHSIYYINNGVDFGLKTKNMKGLTEGVTVTIWYAKHWTPLDPKHKMKHITKFQINEEVVFSEWN